MLRVLSPFSLEVRLQSRLGLGASGGFFLFFSSLFSFYYSTIERDVILLMEEEMIQLSV